MKVGEVKSHTDAHYFEIGPMYLVINYYFNYYYYYLFNTCFYNLL